jgi:glutamate-5-semialdehyde dehydrogenase
MKEPQFYRQDDLNAMVRAAKRAAAGYQIMQTRTKNSVLIELSRILERRKPEIQKQNREDYDRALAKGLEPAICDRLLLTDGRYDQMVQGLLDVSVLPDPVGRAVDRWVNPDGLLIEKVRVPLGLVGVIYESRPNVTVEVFSLCLKAGCAIVLRGGSEAIHSNQALVAAIHEALESQGVDPAGTCFLPWPDRSAVVDLLSNTMLDVVIPRGGAKLMETVTLHARVPVLRHDQGICHVFVGASADPDMALSVAINAKTDRPSTCNAMETLLVHSSHLSTFLPRFIREMKDKEVVLYGCPRSRVLDETIRPASPETYRTEFLSLAMNVRVVDTVDEAMVHIAEYGSGHTDAILTNDLSEADRFQREVDSSCVMVNASTRLHDGFAFGLGAEVGISTTRIHARGTMGLPELTTTKYLVRGNGHLRNP